MDARVDGLPEDQAAEAATQFSYDTAERLHRQWLSFYGELFATFVDGYITVPNQQNTFSGCDKQRPPVSEDWARRIVDETGDRYRVPEHPSPKDSGAIHKARVLAAGEARGAPPPPPAEAGQRLVFA